VGNFWGVVSAEGDALSTELRGRGWLEALFYQDCRAFMNSRCSANVLLLRNSKKIISFASPDSPFWLYLSGSKEKPPDCFQQ
jgi:hypothetical protein